jgi:UDP-glucuronate 4-epimerase
MRYAVTGAAGFIGSQLCETLVAAGHEVVGIDNFDDFYEPERKHRNLEALTRDSRFRIVSGDVRDAEATRATVRGVDGVVHLAARAGVRPSFDDPVAYLNANVAASSTLLEAIVELEVPRLVFISSSSVYGDGAESPFREDRSTGIPRSPYAATKAAGEAMCRAFEGRIPHIAVLRLFSVYGPRQRPDLALQTFARCMHEGEPIPVLGTTDSFRDYTYVEDIITGISLALEVREPWTLVNLGSGHPVTLEDMIGELESAFGTKAERKMLPSHPGDLFGTWADTSAAQEKLGFRPEWTFERGVRSFVEWFRQEAERSGGAGRPA